MNKIDSTLSELLNMLVTTEGILKDSKGTVLVVERASTSKIKSTWKRKSKPAKNQKQESKLKKDALKKVADKGKCFHCNNDSHWKRNCPIYLESLKKKKGDISSEGMSDLLVIETTLVVFSTSSWVIDFDSNTHLCTSMQGLVESRD